MNKKIVRISAIALLFAMNSFAQEQKPKQLDEVVISDSKFALPKEKSGKVIVKITAEDLKKKTGQSVATIISTVAGVEINGNQSRNGKDLGLYIRGGRNHQVLILIDGVPVTDASGINLSYDLRLLPVDQIESIEIMKGASSTLYGSGAATGVINITLKKAGKKAIAGNVYMNMGTQTVAKKEVYSVKDYNQGFALNGSSEKFNYFASLNSTETSGISDAKSANDAVAFEDDRFSRVNSIVKLGFTPTKKLSLDFFANYDRMKNDFDAGAFADDKINYSVSEQYRIGFSPKYKYDKGELVLNAGASKIDRNYSIFSSWTNSIDKSLYQSRNVSADLFNKYQIISQLFVVTGGQFQFYEMVNETPYGNLRKEDAKFSIVDPYATVVYNSDFGLNVNSGARLNIHSKYGNNFVFNVNPSYSFSDVPLKVLASYSTAYITPSLYQLYSPYGNINLSPEKDATIEAGVEAQFLDKKITFNVVAFHREEKEAIDYSSATNKYYNIGGRNIVRGIETELNYSFTEKLKFQGNYTFFDLDRSTKVLNPKHKVNASLDFQANARLAFSAAYQFVSDRDDLFGWPSKVVVLKDYQLVNANVRYELIKNRMNVFAAADNILDKDFVEKNGYSTRGRNFKAGLNILF
jgi:vitamin B12 transporter